MSGGAPGRALLTSVAELRHELRTPVNHIVGYAEMLLEDLPAGAGPEERAALEETLDRAREILELIQAALPPTRTEVEDRDVTALLERIREPQQRIVRALSGLLATGPDTPIAEDLTKIIRAAGQLLALGAAVDPAGGHAGHVEPGRAGERPRAAARILVVDDVEANRDVLGRRLAREGYAVTAADNGRAALEKLRAEPFDLVLLDILMPELDGYEVLRQLKSAPETRDVPVIMISALDELSSIVRCIEQGAEDYLPKPFDPVLLRARIGACLEKKRLRDAEKEYLQEVGRVIDAATAVERGSYEPGSLATVARRDDELGRLARVFDGMVAQIQAREARLREQVEHLRREIQTARRASDGAGADALDGGNLAIGEVFAGRYVIQAAIGAGGMGTVYRARDLELEEEVAIKTLRPELVTDATLVERFKTEIRLARRISHRNVVRTHDLGEWNGIYFLTMEYVEGLTVRELLDQRGRLEISSTLAIARQLAESLAVAHEQGVVHRDIKPQNLLLDPQGVLKVMDFGVARLAERTSALTEAGLIIGTPSYMAPEQLLAESIDARADLYAAGVVLFECLTGRLPFDAGSTISLVAKVLNEPPPAPVALNAEIPPPLSALILRLLAKKPDQRIQTAGELAEQLARVA